MLREIVEGKRPTVKEFKSLIKHLAGKYSTIANMDIGVRSVGVTPGNEKYDEFKEKVKNCSMFKNGLLEFSDEGGTSKKLKVIYIK